MVQQVDVFSPETLARHLATLRGQFTAVLVMGLDHPLVRAAIDDLVMEGTTVITLVSDVPSSQRAHYVGIDNVAAGRTAGCLLGRFAGAGGGAINGATNGNGPRKVGIVLGSHALRDHAERLFGFQQVLAAEHPQLTLLAPLEGHDDSVRTRQLVSNLLKREKTVGGHLQHWRRQPRHPGRAGGQRPRQAGAVDLP